MKRRGLLGGIMAALFAAPHQVTGDSMNIHDTVSQIPMSSENLITRQISDLTKQLAVRKSLVKLNPSWLPQVSPLAYPRGNDIKSIELDSMKSLSHVARTRIHREFCNKKAMENWLSSPSEQIKKLIWQQTTGNYDF